MAIVDVSNPTALIEIETYRNPLFGAKLYPYNHLAIDGDIVYAAVDYCGVETINVGDEGHLVQEDWWNPWGCELLSDWWLGSPGHSNQIELDLASQRAIVSAGDSEVLVLDISDPSQLRLIGQFGQPGNGEGVWGAHLADGIVYATYIENAIPFPSSVSALRAYAVPEPRFSVMAIVGVFMLASLAQSTSRHA